MSKLADLMRRAARQETRPIGFAVTTAQRQPTMLVLARVPAAQAAAAAAAGADAVIVADGQAATVDLSRILWGSEAPVAGRDDVRALRAVGAGFLVFDADTTPAAALLEDDVGYIMRVDPGASDTFLRSVETLPLDGLLVPSLEGALTVRRALDLRRISSFTRKMLVLGVAPTIDPVDLEALRDSGVIGVVVDGVEGITAVRAKVDALPPRQRSRDGRGVSIALRATGTTYQVEEFPAEPEEE